MTIQILGDFYEVERQIAKKAGRKTLLCRDLRSNELVVVKLVSFDRDFEWEEFKLFQREAETLKSLSYPAIPQYLDYFEIESDHIKSFALVQTHIPAKSLQEHLQAGRSFSEGEVQELAKALLEILIYLHNRNPPVIHRDLKPSNVLLGDRTGNSIGQVYLVDFGSVQSLAAKEGGTITVVGTYGYMPPEQFGDRTVPASDLYSLGATLICVLTGTHPADLPQKDGCIQFAESVNISSNFALWLEQTIQPSLDKRFTSAQQALQTSKNPPPVEENQVVVKKPAGSRVLLTKDIYSLEILIPLQGFRLETLGMIGATVGWNWFVLCFTTGIVLATFPPNPLFILSSVPFWIVGIRMILRVLLILLGQVKLSLDCQRISLTYKLFGFKYSRLIPVGRKDITQLEYMKEGFEYNSKHIRKADSHKINIRAGIHKYELGNRTDTLNNLTPREFDWLVHELNSWLGVPIVKLY